MPLVSKTFDQLLDFTRTTAATFVGSNGLIQNTPASVNLLTFTQQFDNGYWFKTNLTVTANSTVAPDGTSTADKLVATAGAGFHGASGAANVTSGVSYTLSFYVKAAEYSKVYISDGSSGGYTCAYDLAAGTAGTPGGVYTGKSASITNTGNGWYRCTLSFTATVTQASGPGVAGYPDTGATFNNFGVSYTGDGTSGAFVWGAQLELGSTATTYTRNNGGVFPPRFDYDPVTLAPKGILIEDQRTNLLVYSGPLTTGWSSDGVATMVPNVTTSPDGAVNASQLQFDTGGYRYHVAGGATISTVYTASIFAKLGTGGDGTIRLEKADGPTGGATFNLNTLAITFLTATSASITPVGNGWFRCAVVFSATATSTAVGFSMGGTFTSGQGHYFWGAQLEAGTFATSYIPTVASQVTRTSDYPSIVAPNFAPWYNQSEGTFLFEGSSYAPSTLAQSLMALTVSDGTNNNLNRIGRFSNLWFGDTRDGNVQQASLFTSGSYTQNATAKVAYVYKTNDFAVSINGATVVTDTSGTVPTVVDRLDIGGTGAQLYGHIRSIRYFPTRLSNAQLQALTA